MQTETAGGAAADFSVALASTPPLEALLVAFAQPCLG